MTGEMRITGQGFLCGRVWVEADHEARAITVTLKANDEIVQPVTTQDIDGLLLIDRDATGEIVSVEIIA